MLVVLADGITGSTALGDASSEEEDAASGDESAEDEDESADEEDEADGIRQRYYPR